MGVSAGEAEREEGWQVLLFSESLEGVHERLSYVTSLYMPRPLSFFPASTSHAQVEVRTSRPYSTFQV